ncbi:MAG: TonB-dependent receptor [Bacteroidota bacterium]
MKFCNSYYILLLIAFSLTTYYLPAQSSDILDTIKIRLGDKQYDPNSIIEEIENQTEFKFIFDPSIFPQNSTYNFGESVVLSSILVIFERELNISFKLIDSSIYLKKEKNNVSISGLIVDSASGEPLVGATVRIENTSIGAIADATGEFKLSIPDSLLDKRLQFSYVGFINHFDEIILGKSYEIGLEPNLQNLDEIVVVGYGIQKKKDITGSISKVDSKKLSVSPQSSPIHALQGLATGVDIVSQSFAAGNEPTIRIRGERSILASNDPLIILDGIPYEGTINDVNPLEVASIEVLKDASATAIYGSRAANGVILITTKRGSEDGLSIEFTTFYGLTQPLRYVDMMSPEEFTNLRLEAERTRFQLNELPSVEEAFDPFEQERLRLRQSTDWQDEIYGEGSVSSVNLSVGGAIDGKKQYFFSAGFFEENYPIENVDYRRINLRVNFDTQPSENLTFGSSTFFSQSRQNTGGFGGDDGIDQVYRTDPLSLVRDSDGSPLYMTSEDPLRFNPIFNTLQENFIEEELQTRVFPNFFFQLNLSDAIYYRLNVGGDLRFRKSNRFRGNFSTANKGEINDVRIRDRENIGYTLENIIQYDNYFGEHSISSTMLFSVQERQQVVSTMSANQLNQAPDVTFFGIDDAVQFPVVDNQKQASQLVSGMIRMNYKYQDRYLVTLTARADGSSVLAEGNKWAFFPSVGLGWNIFNEAFFTNQSLFDDFRIRASYGVTGNQAIDAYDSKAGLNGTDYFFGEVNGSGFATESIANDDLKWERTEQLDIGLDFAVLNGRVRATMDYYEATTRDLLFERRIPLVNGFESIVSNIGSTKNKGIEIALGISVIDRNDFKWNVDLNLARNTNEIIDLFGDSSTDDIGNNLFIGQPIRVFYDNVFNGIWQLEDEVLADSYGFDPGDIRLVDLNQDSLINDDDRKVLGSQLPEWIGGVFSNWSYKGFDLSVLLNARWNYLAKNEFKDRYNTLVSRDGNVSIDYWTPENPSNSAPRPNRDDQPDNLRVLTYEDASFIRIRNITLGYTLPQNLSKKVFAKNIRIYATAVNPFLFTDFEGIDPEQPTFGGGTKRAQAANTRQFITGLNIKF